MITPKSNITTQSNLPGQGVSMTLDQNSLAHLMSVLTNLYSDPIMAVIREYSTNALDSQIKAGNSAPIRVTLPTPLDLTFRVKDQGLGLSPEDAFQAFGSYGKSGSRETNDAVGMFGLGSKSALSYTNSFTVITIKDGVKATLSIQRSEAGGGSMKVVDTVSTQEHNGVEVIVPAKSNSDFEGKARAFFAHWTPGTVLVNGREPNHIVPLLKVSDEISIVKGYPHTVVMGNVPYSINRYQSDVEEFHNLSLANEYALVVTVPIGSVDLVPSREALHFTSTTKETLNGILKGFSAKLAEALSRELQNVPTRFEALCWIKERSTMTRGVRNVLVYRGQSVPTSIPAEEGRLFTVSTTSGKLSHHEHRAYLDTTYVPEALFIHGFTQNYTASVKKKLMQYIETNNLSGTIKNFILFTGSVDKTWLNRDRFVDWKTIKAIKLPRAASTGNGGYSLGGEYECLAAGESTVLSADDINDLGLPIFYGIASKDVSFNDEIRILKHEHGEDFVFVTMYGNRVEKFTRLCEDATTIHMEARRIAEKWVASVPEELRLAKHIQGYGGDLRKLRGLDIKDPAVLKAIKALSVDTSPLVAQINIFGRYGNLADTEWESPLENYPLVNNLSYYHWREDSIKDHIVTYMNAVYEASQTSARI